MRPERRILKRVPMAGRGRLEDRGTFNCGAPIVLVAYGERNLESLKKSGLGFTVALRDKEIG
ncbi:MAG: hypothetical protein P0119_22795 [Nitrospira sp.]|nr:hypothetical protein [Nitrospira sp.]